MSWQHFSAFVWLRWRLLRNQWSRSSTLNAVILTCMSVFCAILAIPLFFGSIALGRWLIPQATPEKLMYVWDGLIFCFLFIWFVGLMSELQRTESLSLSKFLHLPVSLRGAFFINYLSSLMRVSLLLFGPVMSGYAIALIWVQGWRQVPVLFALAAFLLMISALTYQFQGWLASLLSNPRRRRMIIMSITLGFVLLCQLPNLVNVWSPWSNPRDPATERFIESSKKLDAEYSSGRLDRIEYANRQRNLGEEHRRESQNAIQTTIRSWERVAETANLVLPIGWLPLGVRFAASGNVFGLLLATFGMTLIGSASLWRAYRTTLRIYTGVYSTTAQPRASARTTEPTSQAKPLPAGRTFLEWQIPGLSEQVSAVALSGLRTLLRAPESRMMLLSPLFIAVAFGSAIFRGPHQLPDFLRVFIALSAMLLLLLGLVQIMFNQFGFDRDGFRVFVLCSASRRDILLGKNLAFAPIAFVMLSALLIAFLIAYPLRWDHFLSLIPQAVSMYLLFCLLANWQSIYAPAFLAAGSLRVSSPKTSRALLQLLLMMVVLPLSQIPLLLPVAIEATLVWLGWDSRLPICLFLSLIDCAGIVALYRAGLRWQGSQLQSHEQSILESVTNRAV